MHSTYPNTIDKLVWTDEDLAAFFEIRPQTVKNRVSQGLAMPPHAYIGGKRRWSRDAVLKWFESRQVSTEA